LAAVADILEDRSEAGLPQSRELSLFDKKNSPSGSLGRYLSGRCKDLPLRISMNFMACLGLTVLFDFQTVIVIFFTFLSADLLESMLFYRMHRMGHQFWESKVCQSMVLATSCVVACISSAAAASVWLADDHPNRLLAMTLFAGLSLNSGFFVYLYRPANYIRQCIYLCVVTGLFVNDFYSPLQSVALNLVPDLLASTGFVICLISCYARLAGFANNRLDSERTYLIAKLDAEHATTVMHHQARHDSLTGLPNRAYLAEFLAEMMLQSVGKTSQFAIFHIDLDKFKEVNDTAGHAAGDFVLESSATALRNSVRGDDFVARIGGDEFVVVSQSDVEIEHLFSIANRIIEAISKPIMFMDQELRVGASVGFALSEPYHANGEAVLLDADLALYEAKNDGRGVARAFEPNMRSEFEDRTRIVTDLITGLEKGEIETYFQPQVDLHSHLVTGFEALVRWQHPELGLMQPDRFLKIAEDAGLLKDLTLQVAEQSFEALQIWRNAGYEVPSIGLNFASRQLEDRETVSQIKWMVETAGLIPEDITIEVLESVLASANSDNLIRNIKALSAAGFSIDLDDFGTEHASIANMRSFEVQRIKIDKGFIEDIEHRPDQQRLVSAMVQLARSLDVQVLAEGVETGAEIDILASLGCDQVQGYFFARPMDLEASLIWLANCGLIKRHNVKRDEKAALF